jgi:hypothetical protein
VEVRGLPEPLLAGTLFGRVVPDQCIWSLNQEQQSLDLMLEKADGQHKEFCRPTLSDRIAWCGLAGEHWNMLLQEYPNVTATLTAAQVGEIKDRWAALTSDKLVGRLAGARAFARAGVSDVVPLVV